MWREEWNRKERGREPDEEREERRGKVRRGTPGTE